MAETRNLWETFLEKLSETVSSNIFTFSLLTATLTAAFLLRILPAKWGIYLSGLESYWHYYVAKHMVEQGYSWIFQPQGWIDKLSWYPEGRDVAATTFLGVPLTVAAFTQLFQPLGLTLETASFLLPPVMATLTCLTVYFLGVELAGRRAGLLASLLLAFTPVYAVRSLAGQLDPSTVGMFTLALLSLLIVKASKAETWRRNLAFAVASGLAFAYLNLSWEACYYAGLLMAAFLLVAFTLKKGDPGKLSSAYLITVLIGVLTALCFPKPGATVILSAGGLPVLLGIILALTYPTLTLKLPLRKALALSVALTAAVGFASHLAGITSIQAEEVWAALNPAFRTETLTGILGESVLAFRQGTWASLFLSFGSLIFFAIAGCLLSLRKAELPAVYFTLFLLTSLYAASSLIHMEILASIPVSLLAALLLSELFKASGRILSGRGKPLRRTPVSKVAFLLPAILILLIASTLSNTVTYASNPPPIVSSSLPTGEQAEDWLDALQWLKENLPPGEPVAAWWTHGYWLEALAGKATLTDASLLKPEKAALLSLALLSSEEEAARILKEELGCRYLLVSIATVKHPQIAGIHLPAGFGDEGSWIWMARAAHEIKPEITLNSVDKNGDGFPDAETLLGKAIFYAIGLITEENFKHFQIVYVSPSHEKLKEAELITQIIILKVEG